jgi:hypothetical protein
VISYLIISQPLKLAEPIELRSHIRLTAIPFAPVLVARTGGTLIAQGYIESNPAAGLIMISPPSSNTGCPSNSSQPPLLPTPLPEFTYEPKFPLAILGTPSELENLKQTHRLGKEAHTGGWTRWKRGGVDWLEVDDTSSHDTRNKMEMWMDDVGV